MVNGTQPDDPGAIQAPMSMAENADDTRWITVVFPAERASAIRALARKMGFEDMLVVNTPLKPSISSNPST